MHAIVREALFSLQPGLGQVSVPAHLLCEDIALSASCTKDRLCAERQVELGNFRRFCPCGIIIAKFDKIDS